MVGWTNPRAGTYYVPHEVLTLAGYAADYGQTNNGIQTVTLFIDGAWLGEAAVVATTNNGTSGFGTWSYEWTPVRYGAHTLAAVAVGASGSATGTVQAVFNGTNTPPAAQDVGASVVGGGWVNIYPRFTDAELGQTNTVALVTPPTLGVVTAWPSYFRYGAPAGTVGVDTFAYRVHDGYDESNVAVVTVTNRTNGAPSAWPVRADVPVNSTNNLIAAAYADPDPEQTLSLELVAAPAHGTASVSGASFRYTPAPDYAGEDAFLYAVSDGVTSSAPATARLLVRAPGARAGQLVLLVVRRTLLPELAEDVERLRQDLVAEGYDSRTLDFPAGGTASNLWAALRDEFGKTNQWLAGAILIGSLPVPNNTSSGGGQCDLAYWNLQEFQTAVPVSRFDIWVSRFYAAGALFGSEVPLLKQALRHNHEHRTGRHRLPHTAYFYHAWESYALTLDKGAKLLEVWPSLLATNETAANGDHATKARFFPERGDISEAGADAYVGGGELFQETSHGNAGGYMNAAFTRADIQRLGSQVRAALLESCTTGALGGPANHHLLARIGGAIFAVSGSAINYVGDFQLAAGGAGGNAARVRQRLAAGDSWGQALAAHYPFQARNRTMYYGDLSCGARTAPANALPAVTLSADRNAVEPGGAIAFRIAVADPDAADADNPEVEYEHRVEWYPEGNDSVPRPPAHVADSSAADWTNYLHRYDAPGRYTARVEVADEWGARGWRELSVTVNRAPLAGPDRFAPLAGQSATVNALTNDWDPDGHPLSLSAAVAPQRGTVVYFGDYLSYTATNRAWTGTDIFVYRLTDTVGATALGTCTVAVAADTAPPAPRLAGSFGEPDALLVLFDEELDPDSATNLAHYGLNRGGALVGAERLDARTVRLRAAGPLPEGRYALSVSNLRDLAEPPNVLPALRLEAWVTRLLAADDFESGDALGGVGWEGGWNLGGGALSTNSPGQGAYGLALDNHDTPWRTVSNGLAACSRAWLHLGARAKTFQSGQTARAEVQIGDRCFALWSLGDGGDDDVYRRHIAELPPDAAGASNALLRLALEGPAGGVLRLDDVRLVGVGRAADPWPEVELVEPTGGVAVAEGQGEETVAVRLRAAPAREVSVRLTPDAQLRLDLESLVFTPENWNTVQTVRLWAADDDTVEGLHSGRVAVAVASADPDYDGLPTPPLAVRIADNEAYGALQFDAAEAAESETQAQLALRVRRVGGAWGAVSVAYASAPLSAAPDADYRAVTGRLEWAHGDASDRQIAVPLLDDSLPEDEERFQVRLAEPAGGAALGTPAAATCSIRDDEDLWSGMTRRLPIVFSGYERQEPLTNFPTLIVLGERLSEQGFDSGSFADAGGADLRFLDGDGATRLAHEIESWSGGAEAYVWVRIPLLTNGHRIFAYWGNTNARTAPLSQTDGSVWSPDFSAVWHLGAAGSAAVRDATSNGHDGAGLNFAGGESAAGVAGGATLFTAAAKQAVSIPHTPALLPTDAFTVEIWASSLGAEWVGNNSLLAKHNHAQLAPVHGAGRVDFKAHRSNAWTAVGFTPPDIRAWRHYAGTYDGRVLSFYGDGRLVSNRTVAAAAGPVTGSASNLFLGADGSGANNSYFDGLLDEARVSRVARSADWLWAVWRNLAEPEGFYRAGPVEILESAADVNRNGIPDGWELRHFGNLHTCGGTGVWHDADADGMSDGQEYRAGTDPTQAASRLAFVAPSEFAAEGDGDAGLVLCWPSVSGRWYTIQHSPGLAPAGFTTLVEGLPATPALNVHTAATAGAGQGFFRLRVE